MSPHKHQSQPEFPASATPLTDAQLFDAQREWFDAIPADPSPLVEEITAHTSLYDLTGICAVAFNRLDSYEELIGSDVERGHAIDTAIRLIAESTEAIEDKIIGCMRWRQGLVRGEERIKAEEARLACKRMALADERERFEKYVHESLERLPSGKIQTPILSASLRPSTRVVIDDEAALPSPKKDPALWHPGKVVAAEPDKNEIKRRIKAGEIVSGARLEESKYVKWS